MLVILIKAFILIKPLQMFIYSNRKPNISIIYIYIYIVTHMGLALLIIMGSGFDDWIYWHFFTITVSYKSSHIELLLNDVCLMNLYEQSLTNLGLI
jgi:presenilin-like A22 family membrane protease